MKLKFLYQDIALSIEERVDDLVSRMTLEEKVSQMIFDAPAIERLGVPKYNWWNECLHGVGRAGIATVFPQAIGLAATWNADLGEFVLRYEDVRRSEDPEATLMQFLQSTYEAAARFGRWDRKALECEEPDGPDWWLERPHA